MIEILENVKVFARSRPHRRQQGYDNTLIFSSKTVELKITAFMWIFYSHNIYNVLTIADKKTDLTLLHSGRPKLYAILAFLSAIGLTL